MSESDVHPQQHQIPAWLSVVLGLALLATPLVFIVQYPTFYVEAQFYLRLTASLGGAFLGALLPGAINIQTPTAKAVGALAVFLLVFTIDPSWDAYKSVAKEEPESNELNIPERESAELPSPSPDLSEPTGTVDEALVTACVEGKRAAYETLKFKEIAGGARAKSPGLSGSSNRSSTSICLTVEQNQEIVEATTTELSCHGGRCSVSSPQISDDGKGVCVEATAWSDSTPFGGGGSGQYKLVASYRDLATEELINQFRTQCRA